MDILYFGSACSAERLQQIMKSSPKTYFIAQYNLEMAFLKGMVENGSKNIEIYNIPQYKRGMGPFFLKRKKERMTEELNVSYLTILNIPICKEFILFFHTFFITIAFLYRHKNKDKVIISAFSYLPINLATFVSAKLFRAKRTNIFTDLSQDIMTEKRQDSISWLKKKLVPMYIKCITFLDNNFDLYILLTEPMNNIVNTKKKPYIVIEGIFNDNLDYTKKERRKTIVYSGTLTEEYGVGTIVKAFERINNKDLELWLIGSGPLEELKTTITSENIVFFGYLPREKVFDKLKESSLVLNIRNPKDDFTKYSFPSKTFEYLASATPMMSTKLEGIPNEYFDYIIELEDDAIETVRLSIENFFSNDNLHYFKTAEKGERFVLSEKNPKVQARKIINFLKESI